MRPLVVYCMDTTRLFGDLDQTLDLNLELINFSEISNQDGQSFRRRWEVKALWVEFSPQIDERLLDLFPKLELVALSTTSNSQVDTKALEVRGIDLLSLRDYPEFMRSITSTAELTWALILAVWRRIRLLAIDDGNLDLTKRYRNMPTQLIGKTIGIIGYGRVGQQVTSYAKAFGMKVQYCDPFVKINFQNSVDGVTEQNLVNLLRTSDIVVICASKLDNNSPIINIENFEFIKNGAVLINTARGSLWDEKVVHDGLISGVISGVGVDVYACEEFESRSDNDSSLLFDIDQNKYNIIRTGHVGGATSDALSMVTRKIAYEIQRYFGENFSNFPSKLR